MTNKRYSGPPTVLRSYMTAFAVECPNCQHEARVTVADRCLQENGTLVCSNCMHVANAADLVRYKATIKRNCDTCGKGFKAVIPNLKQEADEIAIPCPHCGTLRNYKPRNEKYKITTEPKGRAVDPVFGLPLWFQADVRGNLFWACNRGHLDEIKSYVGSALRERQTTTHTTMVERLPKFIKDAKNRETILKAIDRLQRKGYS